MNYFVIPENHHLKYFIIPQNPHNPKVCCSELFHNPSKSLQSQNLYFLNYFIILTSLFKTPLSFQFQLSTCDEMQDDNDTPSHETEPSGYFFMNCKQLYLIIPNYTHFYCTQLYTIVQIYIIIYTIMFYLLYNIFTNVECEPSPIIELNDTIPSSDNGTSSTNATNFID